MQAHLENGHSKQRAAQCKGDAKAFFAPSACLAMRNDNRLRRVCQSWKMLIVPEGWLLFVYL